MSEPARWFHLRTCHDTFVFVDTDAGKLRHGTTDDHPDAVLAMRAGDELTLYWRRPGEGLEALSFDATGQTVAPGLAQPFDPVSVDDAVALRSDDRYLCAELDGRVVHDRDVPAAWERFTLIAVEAPAGLAPAGLGPVGLGPVGLGPVTDADVVGSPVEPPLAAAEIAPVMAPPATSPLPAHPVPAAPTAPPPGQPEATRTPTGWPPAQAENGLWRRLKRALTGGG